MTPTRRRGRPLLALGACLLGCSPCNPAPRFDAAGFADAAPRRPASPPSPVRAYPPHAIRDDGVGPYLLGQNMQDALRELPEGPHLELLEVGRYANWRVARAEQGAIIIGADARNQVAFVSVLAAEVARTQAGVGVGATGAELRAALGEAAPEDAAGVVRGRQVFSFAALPAVHFLTSAMPGVRPEEAKVVAVVVSRPAAEAEPVSPRRPSCAAPPAATWDEILAAARVKPAANEVEPPLASGCISAAAPEAVLVAGGELVVVAGEPGRLRRVAALPIVAADLLGVVDLDADGREEIVTAVQRERDREHFVEVRLFRWEAGKLAEVLLPRPFSIDEGAAAAAGVRPGEIDLVVELRAVRSGLEVAGFYTARRNGQLTEVAPLTPVVLKVDPRRGASAGAAEKAAGAPDATPSADSDARDGG
jgi:hypothetical protein